MPSTSLRFWLILVLTHLASGILLGIVAGWGMRGGPNVVDALYVGLFFCQTSLLGIWGGLATLRWQLRLLGITIGIAYLVLQFGFVLGERGFATFLVTFLSTVAVAAVMLIVRRRFSLHVQTNKETITVGVKGLQFSIRHMMLLTLFVGCTLAVGRLLKPYLLGVDNIALIVALSTCSVSVGVTSVWAMLGTGQLLLRSCAVLPIGLLGACVLSFYLYLDSFWIWGTVMTMEAVVLLVSLFAVRVFGYRLVRVPKGPQPAVGLV